MLSRRFDRVARDYRAVCMVMVGVALLSGGCASQQANGRRADASGPSYATQRVRLEDDGLPTQIAPRDMRPMPDDPSQPWSPNYGTRPRVKEITPSRAPAPVEAGPTRVATVDTDALVRRAIAEHEMQRQ